MNSQSIRAQLILHQPMTTLSKLQSAVHQFGGSLENDSSGDMCVYQCVAPEGFVWKCAPDVSTLVVLWPRGSNSDKKFSLQDALDRVSEGVVEGVTEL
jgi:hypothetical protein